MRLPPGFSTGSSPGKVCRLRKSLYGLRQSPRNWFAKLTSSLRRYGFQQSHADHTLFTYQKGEDVFSLLVKGLGPLKYFLGIECNRSSEGMFLNQRKYALDILQEAGLLATKPVESPLPQNHQLALSTSKLFEDPARYRRLVGRLIYLTITHPDLSYAVHILSQFMQAPRQDHYDAAIRVLRYIKGHPGQGLFLRADSDLQLRSVSGYFVLLENSLISWKTKKQTTVSRSSAEAEYRVMAHACAEVKWLKVLLHSLGVRHRKPIHLFCDNQAAIYIASNPVFHERSKHIEIDCHFVRELLMQGVISTAHVRTKFQLADLFTKALGVPTFSFLLSKLGVRDLYAPT
ncbi:uncharacterized protein LOC110725491 [Chenopodium quinoa]|uniref:uncharacterized protein LOC110725491 n=1 Tax=Chenopodium quinoa TaxID=63459 RepID=UPI000B7760FF|nr:uncharacterized protein LOC110725491 [Chenopodium quinoa]